MTEYAPIGQVPLAQRFGISSRAANIAKYTAGAAVALLVIGNLVASNAPSLRSEPTSTAVNGQPETLSSPSSYPGALDEITKLAGMPSEYSSRLFSGYLPIGNGGEEFYFFAESQSDSPEHDPVLLWLNGGPGASSLAGCFSENGPLLVNDDGRTLRVNEYAWNMNANFLCIESPVGVGFSYNVSNIYVSDDEAQAEELYWALQQFFVKFPWLRENEFIISGESYGGIYVPTTAKRIVEGNLAGVEPRINLKKFVVGNGVNEFAGVSILLYAYYHGIVGTEEYLRVRESCPDLQEFKPAPPLTSLDLESTCGKAMVDVYVGLFTSHINAYNIYGACAGTTEGDMQNLVKELLAPQSGLPHPVGNPMSMCLNETNLVAYFNQPEVREGMHTNMEIAKWDNDALTTTSIGMFGRFLGFNDSQIEQMKETKMLDYSGTLNSVVTPLWTYLLAHDVPGVIYHGDADMVCDFIGGMWAVESLKLPRHQKRTPWTVTTDGDTQTGGFFEDFGDLKYVTVKGAGHLVPQWRPVEAKQMLDQFVLER